MKGSGEPTEWTEIDRYEGGVGWMPYPEETMQRASHAIAEDGSVWVIDPVDVPGLDDLLAEFGTVEGVVLLLDRHKRDCAAVANRHDVPVYVPSFMDGVEEDLDAPVERIRHELPGSNFSVHEVCDRRVWQEALLFNRETGVLVVPEAVGTTDYFVTASERLGVHPMLRLTPPGKLTRLDPERILVGHGEGIHEDASEALEDAISGSRMKAPGLLVKNTLGMLPFTR